MAYREANHPTHLLELMDREVLDHLLNGFAYKLQAGVSILYSTGNPAEETTLERIDPRKNAELARQVMHEFCRRYRDGCPAHNSRCENWDKSVALNYYRGSWSEPAVYRCHLDLWDMTYPLLVNGNVVGVLFGGQMVLREADHDGALRRLSRIEPKLRFEPPGLGRADQIADIRLALVQEAELEQRDSLRKLLESRDMKTLSAEEFAARVKDFLDFGRTMDLLLAKLYGLLVDIEGRKLLQSFEMELAGVTAQAMNRDTWRGAAAEVVQNFEEMAETGAIRVFYLDGSGYIEVIGDGKAGARARARRVPARLCFSIGGNEFFKLTPAKFSELAAAFGVDTRAWMLRCESPAGRRGFSVVFLLEKDPLEHTVEFCRMVARRAEIADALYRSMEDQQIFADRVRHVSHAVKTPLMVALTEMRRIRRSIAREDPPERRKAHVDNAQRSILDARAEMAGIYGAMPPLRKRVDLRDLLTNLKRTMDPLAETKRCTIALDLPSEPLFCEVCEPEIRVAFRNLLDNAIKYSFDGRWISIVGKLVSPTYVEIMIENYGVGIPADKPGALLEWGVRGDVEDPKKPAERKGSGLGVPIARELICKHGGTIDFFSRPTARTEPGTWLNCVTRVAVTLPLANHKKGI